MKARVSEDTGSIRREMSEHKSTSWPTCFAGRSRACVAAGCFCDVLVATLALVLGWGRDMEQPYSPSVRKHPFR
jgi:hypothetical protein